MYHCRKAYKTNERIIVGYDIRLLRFWQKGFRILCKRKEDVKQNEGREVWEESICFPEIAIEC